MLPVVTTNFLLPLALIPCSCMVRRTRSLPTRVPCATSSLHILGQLYSPLTWAWMARMWASRASLLIRRLAHAGIVRSLVTQVRKVATGADFEQVAHHGNRPLLPVARYPGVLHEDSLAKYAVAFFRMSRSILTLASCARSRAKSICSALIGLSPAPLSLPLLSSLTHFSSVCLGMPSTLAVTADTWPLLTSLTASILNSSV